MSNIIHFLILTIFVSFVTGCANSPLQNLESPLLYPHLKLQQVGQAQAQQDIQTCRQMADSYVPSTLAKDTGMGAVLGGLGGAAVGGVVGAIKGRPGRYAAMGGAGGATAGAAHAIGRHVGPTGNYKQYVDSCLAEKGYRVIGWQ